LSGFVYDAAVLVAADRNDRRTWADHKARLELGLVPLAPAPVVAQVSRSPRQVQLRRFLRGCFVVPMDERDAHEAGRQALGRLDDGLRYKQQALARDPRSAFVLVQIAISYWHQRKYDDTLVWAQRALDVDPKHMLASEFIAHVYWKIGDVNRFAAHTVRQALVFGFSEEKGGGVEAGHRAMQQVYAPAGLSGVNRFMADQITKQHLDFDAVLKMAFRRAVLYGATGRLDEAFDCLDQGIAFRDPALVNLAVAPEWDSLRGDPRFAERLRSMALSCAT
jgi:tetratricopeptide (TPR) repeat protein